MNMKRISYYLLLLSLALTGSLQGVAQTTSGKVYVGYANYNDQIWEYDGLSLQFDAKVGCAMKVASGVSCAVQSAVLALRGTCIPSTDGIIEDDVEKTIRNLGAIGSVGMKATDRMILDIMLCK